jgi:hypothetical protein
MYDLVPVLLKIIEKLLPYFTSFHKARMLSQRSCLVVFNKKASARAPAI